MKKYFVYNKDLINDCQTDLLADEITYVYKQTDADDTLRCYLKELDKYKNTLNKIIEYCEKDVEYLRFAVCWEAVKTLYPIDY